MKIAILGGRGLLGTILTNYLNKHQVFILGRQDLDLTDFVLVQHWLEKNRPDVVINCATAGGKTRLGEYQYDDVLNNLSIFMNFYNSDQYFDKFINIGSGAEFDVRSNIENVKEDNVSKSNPCDSYGYSKNLISRLVHEKDKFYTLRLFGCFDKNEPDFRLFKKFLTDPTFTFVDRKFDYISSTDFCEIVDFYINNDDLYKDINCVYSEKLLLSQVLAKFNKPVNAVGRTPLNYTGDGSKLASLNLELDGLDKGIEIYGRI